MAEGAAVLLLEELRGGPGPRRHIYGEVLGSASTADAYHITAPSPGGAGAIACMEMALADAGLSPQDIAHINAHGTSTPLNDAAEAEAIAKVFGSPGPLVTSTKGATGHSLGAAGALEAAAVLLSMEHRTVPADDRHHRGRPGDDDRPRHRRAPAMGRRARPSRTRSGSAATTATLVLAPAS